MEAGRTTPIASPLQTCSPAARACEEAAAQGEKWAVGKEGSTITPRAPGPVRRLSSIAAPDSGGNRYEIEQRCGWREMRAETRVDASQLASSSLRCGHQSPKQSSLA
ncbi:hypothetical protein GUJ93_ZPchr0012g21682 [Zizania palustris]|uniref:Uncharacterized protein n=1 Tax=Zizania palustris TaxID=103762 RepID=A0A8J5WP42_ZIZPA|nr:hypothetical protein GUJ93_ZPchr0012g21682 [Zizania palustris]